MSAGKTNTAWGFMAKVESVYGVAETLTGTADGVLLDAEPELDIGQYVYDGDRGKAPSGARLPRTFPAGRFGSARLMTRAIGGGAAYSTAVFPSVHTLLRGSGMQATLNAGIDYTYAPEVGPTGLDSLTMEAYLAGQLTKMYGCYGSFEVNADGPGAPLWTFDFMGLHDLPTDVAIPAITYPSPTNLPPRAQNIAFTLGTFVQGVVRSFRFVANREHDAARVDINAAAAHKGFTPAGRNPTLEVTLERPTLATSTPWHTTATLNPYQLRDLGTSLICSLTVGDTQFQRFKIWAGNPTSAAQAQIVNVDEDFDGPTATWTLLIEFKSSTYAAQDDYTIIFD